MLRLAVLAIVCMGLCPAPVSAENLVPAGPDALRASVYERDIEKVDAALAAAQRAVEAGGLDADANRRLYRIFAVTHPGVISFTRDWIEAKPDSEFAMVARSMVLSRAAWIVRGEKSLRETHPEAIDKFHALRRQAMDLAQAAYDRNPLFLPASDEIIVIGTADGDKTYALEVLDSVMQATPNWGTLTRAFGFAHRGWGGDPRFVEAICDFYAPMVDLGDRDSALHCRIQFLVDQKPYNGWPKMALDLMEQVGDDAWIDGLRFTARLNNHPMNRTEAEALRDIVAEQGFDSLRWAEYYDWNVAMRWQFDLQTEKTLKQVKVRALAALKHDPFSPDLLDILARQSNEVTRTEIKVNGETRTVDKVTPIADSPSPQQQFDYLRRRVVVAPYDPETWRKLAGALKTESLRGHEKPADLAQWDGYLQNSIYYGHHQLTYLTDYARQKVRQLSDYSAISPDTPGLGGWFKALQQMDRTRDLVCPIVRTGILMQAVSDYTGETPEMDEQIQEVVLGLMADARADGLCPGMFAAEPQELAFGPVDMDLMGQVYPFAPAQE